MKPRLVTHSFIAALLLALTPSGSGNQNLLQATAQPEYVLKAWRIADGSETYLWSIEDRSDKHSPGTLYRSLAAVGLRATVGSLPAGTRLSFFFAGGGSMATLNAITGKDFDRFREFCKGKGILFDFSFAIDSN